jgi:hypothetical protein
LAGGGYSAGEIGPASGENYRTWTGSGELQFAINRFFALSAQYMYYNYHFAETIYLPVNVPRRLDRHGFRVGLTGWLPLVPARSRR